MSTLYDIGADLDALAALLTEVGGDVTDEQAAAAIDEWLNETGEALRFKLDRYAALIRERESMANARNAEAARLEGLAAVDLNLVARLKERLRLFFEHQGLKKLETERFRFTLAQNGGKAPVEILTDEWLVPEWAKRTEVTIDKDAIRQAIEKGESIDFARIGERGRHLRIA